MKKIALMVFALCLLSVIQLYLFKNRSIELEETYQITSDTAAALFESYHIKNQIKGLFIDDFELMNRNNETLRFQELLSKKGLHVVVITSYDNCNACRDQELELWNDIHKQNSNLSVMLIVTESEPLNTKRAAVLKSKVKASGVDFPHYFDTEGVMLSMLAIPQNNTPVVCLVDNEGEILNVHRPTYLTFEDSERFSSLTQMVFEEKGKHK